MKLGRHYRKSYSECSNESVVGVRQCGLHNSECKKSFLAATVLSDSSPTPLFTIASVT